MDVMVEVPTLGRVRCDVAFGGMHYAIVNAAEVGLSLEPRFGRDIVRLGEMIKVAAIKPACIPSSQKACQHDERHSFVLRWRPANSTPSSTPSSTTLDAIFWSFATHTSGLMGVGFERVMRWSCLMAYSIGNVRRRGRE